MYILNPRLVADIFDNEYIIANLDTGLYYSVQGIAVALLQALPFSNPADKIALLASACEEKNVHSVEAELNLVWNDLLKDSIVRETTNAEENTAWAPSGTYVQPRFNRYADMQDLLMLDPIHNVDEEGWPVKNP